ncbi:hypothetical protein [Kineosporia sp. NBRC 101731]|uniref:hypothetical protein n=1 Tax=Kineosporia sp. NBRC 101731 TaxID=3032199 RepID=UPI0024A3B824|nr:hypothetical protein [Kineosporia sp. NBRC 101731]GLY32037.1 hypothetical protein Kisp02_54020 [Kineosporia sp. NBRC 101731]
MIINGIDYEARAAELIAAGSSNPNEDDDTVLGRLVYCNQHRRVHATGWCTVSNLEKVAMPASWTEAVL